MYKVFDLKTCILLGIVIILTLVFIVIIRERIKIFQKQEKELQMYKVYVKPLEEFIREIRARQHEFDNHLNAILNMHVTIDNYEELVENQRTYIHRLVTSRDNSYLGLLRISNKVLAGFIYSKIISARENIHIELMVGNKEIFTNVPEIDIVEVIGTLMDNAFEACQGGNQRIKLYLTSENDRLIFIIKNEHDKLSISELSRFFERGYSTKSEQGKRGLGLYHAKMILKEWNGEIFVENEEIDGQNFLTFRVVM